MNFRKVFTIGVAILAICALSVPAVMAQALPGGTLDPTTIPKYVTPLVIPPVMNNDGTGANNYDIAVRQFQQQILPGGIWATLPGCAGQNCTFPATTVWSYGPDADPTPLVAPDPASQFNYPAYTVETMSNVPVSVQWINDLVDSAGNCLPHILPIDQTLHWANPVQDCRDGSPRTDCAGDNPDPYTGPVPIVTHVHGAHVDPHSDGYPEAWWLPVCPQTVGLATSGTLFDDATGANDGTVGYADYWYRQDQPATTLWYHDHSLGMTRSNVYAGPAGFWLIRGGKWDKIKDTATGTLAVLPGPAPVAGQSVLDLNLPTSAVRRAIREIPIVIQDRSFNINGTLFYPANRAFFEGLGDGQTFGVPGNLDAGLYMEFVPDSDIAPTWNPEAFFNVMVVNGVSWPTLEVAPARYRFRLLNGCNSRFLNLAMFADTGAEIPFFQIGAEQGFLRKVVRIETGFATPLPGNGMMSALVPAADPQQALLMGLAERADVIVDFSGLPDGTVVTMTNTAPDAPFGGFPDVPADPGTTGQVMQFVVNSALSLPSDALTSSPYNMKPKAEKRLPKKPDVTRQVSLNEGESEAVCVEVLNGFILQVDGTPPDCPTGSFPFGPKEALLGTVTGTGATATGNPLKWTDTTGASTPVTVTLQSGANVTVNVTENPTLGDTEDWEIYNFTADAHPIHLHLVRFEVVNRQIIGGAVRAPEPWETGFKDTVIAYPGEITTVRSKFDIEGLYVWHCHIVEHEDNEMMRPYFVGP
jgi:FtsP/CotA-like multicopper oxidase with cupredoxin domain